MTAPAHRTGEGGADSAPGAAPPAWGGPPASPSGGVERAPAAAAALTAGVDAREAEYYHRLAETWWDPTGPFWPLHGLNTFRTHYLCEKLAPAFGRSTQDRRPLAGLEVLDVGCGGGLLSEAMARLGARVTGIDVVERNVAIARRHASDVGVVVSYALTTPEALAAEGRSFDVVLSMEVVEHVPDVAAFLSACAALVRPGGRLGLSTINRTALSWLFAIVGAEYVLRWLPRGTHRWDWFVTPDEAARPLRDAGLEVTDSTGVRVNPLTRGFSLTRSHAVNYMLLASRPDNG